MSTRLTPLCAALLWILPAATALAGESYYVSGYATLEEAEARIAELEAELSRYDTSGLPDVTCASGCGVVGDSCGRSPGAPNWFNAHWKCPTVAAWIAGDAWRDASESTWPNNFGGQLGLEATCGLGDTGVRASFGVAYGLYDNHGRFTAQPSSAEQQVYLTGGLYHRACGECDDVWTWGLVYDYLNDNNYGVTADGIDLHQTRVLVGRMIGSQCEFGVWGAFGLAQDSMGAAFTQVEVQDQVNVYWRQYYAFGGETMLYTGLADPNRSVYGVPGLNVNANANAHLREWVIGWRGIAPLNSHWGLFGGLHYVVPSAGGGGGAMDEENWDISFGIMWVRGSNLPVLPVAGNGWFGKRLAGTLTVL